MLETLLDDLLSALTGCLGGRRLPREEIFFGASDSLEVVGQLRRLRDPLLCCACFRVLGGGHDLAERLDHLSNLRRDLLPEPLRLLLTHLLLLLGLLHLLGCSCCDIVVYLDVPGIRRARDIAYLERGRINGIGLEELIPSPPGIFPNSFDEIESRMEPFSASVELSTGRHLARLRRRPLRTADFRSN